MTTSASISTKTTVAVITAAGVVIAALLKVCLGSQAPVQVHVHNNQNQGQQPAEVEQLRQKLADAQAERDRLQREQAERDRLREQAAREAAKARAAQRPHAVSPQRQANDDKAAPPQVERPPVRPRQPVAPVRNPQPPRMRDVTVMVTMENVKLDGCNPLLTLSETLVVRVGGRTLPLEVKSASRSVTGTIQLPEGTHKYVINARAEGQWWPGNGHQPRRIAVTGTGAGDLVVKSDSLFVLRRQASRHGGYEVWLEAR